MKKILITLLFALLIYCGFAQNSPLKAGQTHKTASGLEIATLLEGTGDIPKIGDIVQVYYRLAIKDGKILASNQEKGNPPVFIKIGSGNYIKALDETLLLMKAGTRVNVTIPPSMGFGKASIDHEVPSNTTLMLELLLIDPNQTKKTTDNTSITNNTTPSSKPVEFDENKAIKSATGLKVLITQDGKGEKPNTGDSVYVHYRGTLENGNEFDSSYRRNQPFGFRIGTGQVIKGWDEGIAMLNEGAKAILKIPPQLAYGERAVGTIPANSTLIFEVELVKITRKK
ncbi:MAG: FKBP-type peptidyl-prolyl cis-trans isomerase [Bacteroidia bacterium]|nr:FKBP-type peptidyl-prolyl cis-trans isomerase [Bacteroidia bacterium]MDW8346958.1 FKBP-type peptidyl-prolyl cis-trans isomerase [Bacteroidia bacterium]